MDETPLSRRYHSGLRIHTISPKWDFESDPKNGPAVPITNWQSELQKCRVDSIGTAGIYLDGSATGSGKSTADQAALQQVARGAIVLPTHEQCDDLARDLRDAEFDAVCYPGRFTKGKKQNCWNDEADRAEKLGLSVGASVCPYCEKRKDCESFGYLAAVKRAEAAQVRIATHARGVHNTLTALGKGCEYLAVHEASLDVLLPTEGLSVGGLDTAKRILDRLLSDPVWLDWFGSTGLALPCRETTKEI